MFLPIVKLFPILITVLFSLAGCTSQTQIYRLRDLTRNQQLLLRNQAMARSTYGLLIMSRGYIDGEARVALLLDGEVRKTKVISGNVKFQWRENWHQNRAIIRYQPSRVTDGDLRFSVTFMD